MCDVRRAIDWLRDGTMVANESYTIMPIQNVELTALADRMRGFLGRYDLQSVSITVIAGVDDEKPFVHIRTSDNDGQCNSLTTTWESEDE